MNELTAMETFVRVVEAGSMSAAAEALDVAQPTVSRRLAELESQLQTPLLQRTTRHQELTAAGAEYYEACKDALAAVANARLAARQAAGRLTGRLRIAAPVSLANAWLAPRLPAFVAEHPELDLHLHLSEQFVDFAAHGIEVGLRVGGPPLAGLQGRRVGHVSRRVVATPTWLERHGEPESPRDLSDVVGLVFSQSGRRPRWRFVDEDAAYDVEPRRVVGATNGDLLRSLVLEHMGVAVLPDWLVDDDLEAGRLRELFPGAVEGRDLWVVWPRHEFQSLAVRAFVDWLVEVAAEG